MPCAEASLKLSSTVRTHKWSMTLLCPTVPCAHKTSRQSIQAFVLGAVKCGVCAWGTGVVGDGDAGAEHLAIQLEAGNACMAARLCTNPAPTAETCSMRKEST